MYTNDYILNLLNIKDPNITILPKQERKVIKNCNYIIIEGILTYIPKFCPCCGVVNESSKDIIKWGFRKIVLLKFLKYLTVKQD